MTAVSLKSVALGLAALTFSPNCLRAQESSAQLQSAAPIEQIPAQITFQGPDSYREPVTKYVKETLKEISLSWGEDPVKLPAVSIIIERPAPGIEGRVYFDFGQNSLLSASIHINPNAENLWNALRHELNHVVLYSLCGPLLPRWISEGSAVSDEYSTFNSRYHRLLMDDYLVNGRGIAFRDMFLSKEETKGAMDYPFYAQSASVVEYLIAKSPGDTIHLRRRYFLSFTRDIIKDGADLDAYRKNLLKYYGIKLIGDLSIEWLESVRKKRDLEVARRADSLKGAP
jgi:hypothetical protein